MTKHNKQQNECNDSDKNANKQNQAHTRRGEKARGVIIYHTHLSTVSHSSIQLLNR